MHELGHGVMRARSTLLLRRIAPAAACAVTLAATLAVSGCSGVAQAGPAPGLAPGYGYTCYAGAYMCRLPEQVPQGWQCTCPGLGAPSYGTVR